MGWEKEDLLEMEERYGAVPFGYVVAEDNGHLVGVGNLHERDIVFEGVTVKLGGLGGGCVHENYRHQGIATRLLELRMDELRKRNCDVAYLCTNIEKLETLFAAVGFKPLGKDTITTGKSGRKYYSRDGMIAPLLSQRIFDLIMNESSPLDLQGSDW